MVEVHKDLSSTSGTHVNKVQAQWHMLMILALGRQGKADLGAQ